MARLARLIPLLSAFALVPASLAVTVSTQVPGPVAPVATDIGRQTVAGLQQGGAPFPTVPTGPLSYATLLENDVAIPLALRRSKVPVDSGRRFADATLLIRVDAGPQVSVDSVSAVVRTTDGVPVPVVAWWGRSSDTLQTQSVPLPGYAVTPLFVRLAVADTARLLSGSLIVRLRAGSPKVFAMRERRLRLGAVRPPADADWILEWTFCFALATCFGGYITAIVTIPDVKAGRRVDAAAPVYDPRNSWASNLALGGTLLTNLLAVVVLADQPRYLGKPSYSVLSVLFAGFVVIAATISGGVNTLVPRISDWPKLRVLALLPACLLALWGASGQLATIWAVLGELELSQVLPARAVWWVRAVLYALGVLLFFYGLGAIRQAAPTTSQPDSVLPPTAAKRAALP